jgi:glycine/D-amino acid oxidase-like deaminating enzyme
MHKYVGVQAKLSAWGEEAQNESLKLIEKASKRLGYPLILSDRIVRFPTNPEQAEAFQRAAALHNDLTWDSSTLIIHPGYTIDVTSYLKGLALIAQDQGLIVKQEKVEDLTALQSFDTIILATGAADIPELRPLKIHPVKGQLLVLEWPKEHPPLPYSIIGSVYITMTKDLKAAVVGATYEHHFRDLLPDENFAIKELLPKAAALCPPLHNARLIEVRAGVRASMPNRMPFAGKIKDNLYALVGMGSKGLLYHAYFAKQLVATL